MKKYSEPDDFDFHKIELTRLVEEWVEQDRYFMNYGIQLADAEAEHERSITALKVVEAEIDRDVRSSPGKFGLDKVTEDAIKRVFALQVRWVKAKELVIERKHDRDILDVAVKALEHRKKSLESLSIMDNRNYFSEPRIRNQEVRESVKKAERDSAFGKTRKIKQPTDTQF